MSVAAAGASHAVALAVLVAVADALVAAHAAVAGVPAAVAEAEPVDARAAAAVARLAEGAHSVDAEHCRADLPRDVLDGSPQAGRAVWPPGDRLPGGQDGSLQGDRGGLRRGDQDGSRLADRDAFLAHRVLHLGDQA